MNLFSYLCVRDSKSSFLVQVTWVILLLAFKLLFRQEVQKLELVQIYSEHTSEAHYLYSRRSKMWSSMRQSFDPHVPCSSGILVHITALILWVIQDLQVIVQIACFWSLVVKVASSTQLANRIHSLIRPAKGNREWNMGHAYHSQFRRLLERPVLASSWVVEEEAVSHRTYIDKFRLWISAHT